MSATDTAAFYVYITTANEDEARRISMALLKGHLAACTNLFKGMESAYWWQGEIETATECVLVAKTLKHRLEGLKQKVLELHSYDCPCILAWPVSHGHAPYLEWLKEEVR